MIRIRDILIGELKRSVVSPSRHTLPSTVDWGRLLKISSASTPSLKRVVEMDLLKEVIRLLLRRRFDEVRRSEMKRRSSRQSWHTFYSLIFRDGEDTVGYAAIIYIPEVRREIEKSRGVIHAARIRTTGGGEEIRFEDAGFDDYSIEVKPHIEILGNLYRRTRRL